MSIEYPYEKKGIIQKTIICAALFRQSRRYAKVPNKRGVQINGGGGKIFQKLINGGGGEIFQKLNKRWGGGGFQNINFQEVDFNGERTFLF